MTPLPFSLRPDSDNWKKITHIMHDSSVQANSHNNVHVDIYMYVRERESIQVHARNN